MKKGHGKEMKTLKSAGAVPGRSAAERKHALRSGGGNYRYRIHPPVPGIAELTPGETAAVSGWAVVVGMIVTAPAWWEYAGADVLAAGAAAFGVLCIGMRTLPRVIRKIRRRGKTGLTFVVRRRDEGRRLGYISSDAICAAARYARGERG